MISFKDFAHNNEKCENKICDNMQMSFLYAITEPTCKSIMRSSVVNTSSLCHQNHKIQAQIRLKGKEKAK